MAKKNSFADVQEWVTDAKKKTEGVSKTRDYFENDAKEIATKHGLMFKKPMPQKTINVVESKNPKQPEEVIEEGMIGDAILNSETFKKAVMSVLMSNKKMLADIVNESLKNLHIEVRAKD